MSLNERLVLGALALNYLVRWVDARLIWHYAYELMSSVPMDRWTTFDEVVAESGVPVIYARRILYGYMLKGALEIRLWDAVNSDPEIEKRMALQVEENLGFMGVFEYRRIWRMRPRKKKWTLFPPEDHVPYPVPV